MSSSASEINALSAITLVDLYKRFKSHHKENTMYGWENYLPSSGEPLQLDLH